MSLAVPAPATAPAAVLPGPTPARTSPQGGDGAFADVLAGQVGDRDGVPSAGPGVGPTGDEVAVHPDDGAEGSDRPDGADDREDGAVATDAVLAAVQAAQAASVAQVIPPAAVPTQLSPVPVVPGGRGPDRQDPLRPLGVLGGGVPSAAPAPLAGQSPASVRSGSAPAPGEARTAGTPGAGTPGAGTQVVGAESVTAPSTAAQSAGFPTTQAAPAAGPVGVPSGPVARATPGPLPGTGGATGPRALASAGAGAGTAVDAGSAGDPTAPSVASSVTGQAAVVADATVPSGPVDLTSTSLPLLGAATPSTTSAPPATAAPTGRGARVQTAQPEPDATATAAAVAALVAAPAPAAPAAPAPAAPAPTAGPSAAPPPLVEQLVPRLVKLPGLGEGVHRLTLDVRPEAIGSVTVVAHIRPDSVRIELVGATAGAHEALRGVLDDLRRDLAATGSQASLDLGTGTGSGTGTRGERAGAAGGPWLRTPGTAASSAPVEGAATPRLKAAAGRVDVLA